MSDNVFKHLKTPTDLVEEIKKRMEHHGLTNFQYFVYHAIRILAENQAVNYRKHKESTKILAERCARLEKWRTSLGE